MNFFVLLVLLLWPVEIGIHVSKDGSLTAHGQTLIDKNGRAAASPASLVSAFRELSNMRCESRSSSLICGVSGAGLRTRPVATVALVYGDGSVYAGDKKDMSGGGTLVIDRTGKIVNEHLLHSTLKELTGPKIQCGSGPMVGHVVCARVSS